MGCETSNAHYEHRYTVGEQGSHKCSCGVYFQSFGDWARHAGAEYVDRDRGPSLPPGESRYARFHKLLRELESLHDSKGADYDGTGQEYGNHKAVQDWGIAAWKSPLLRIGEKMRRLQTFAQSGNINYDGVEDSLKDIAVLSLIALILFQEEH